MSELVGQTVRLKITEVNRGRKRVVGSIRAVAQKERRERAEKIWSEDRGRQALSRCCQVPDVLRRVR